MEILETHLVPPNTDRVRLSDYLPRVFVSIPSRKGLKKAIKRGQVWVDGAPAETGRWVVPGQKIELIAPDLPPPRIYHMALPVVYEDEHLAVVNKPGGISVSGNKFRTLQNALPAHLTPSTRPDALKKMLPVHRLDAPTCGLLLVAKTISARINLGQAFENQTVKKRYRAVTIGEMPASGVLDSPIDGKPARTRFERVSAVRSLKNGWLSTVDLFPETGRTHQLRIHLAQAGYPILGDKLYGPEGLILKGKGLFLCAVELAFLHPFSGEMLRLAIAPPPKF
ncbi:MAG: RluA family pseudouridine synthase, partial [Bacteroidetes bacterium]